MIHQIGFTEEELTEVDRLLEREQEASRTELRRTKNIDYHQQISHRLEVIETIRRRIGDFVLARKQARFELET